MNTQEQHREDITPDEKTKKSGMEDINDADLTKVQGGSSPMYNDHGAYEGNDTMQRGNMDSGDPYESGAPFKSY